MADAQITWTGNATQMLQEMAKLDAARKKEDLAYRELKKNINDAAKAERDTAREVAAIKDKSITAQDKYNKAVERLGVLHKDGRITQKEYNRELAEQKRILEQTDGAATSTGAKILGIGREAASTFLGVGSAIGGVMAIASQLKKEYEEAKRRDEERRVSQLSFGDSVREMAVNFQEDATMKRGDIEAAALGISRRTGALPETVAQVLGPTLSAKGNLTNEQAFGVVEQALRVLPGNADASKELASRAGDLLAATGTNDPKAMLGLLAQLQTKARTTDLASLGSTAVPAMIATMQKGDTLEQSAELFATVNTLMNDAEGRRSRTAVEALNVRLGEFAPTTAGEDALGTFAIPQKSLDAFAVAKTTNERIGVLRSNPELRRQFLGSASFELGAKASIESLLSGDARATAIEQSAQAGIGAPDAAFFDSFVGGIDSLDSQALGAANRKQAAGSAVRKILDIKGAATAQARGTLEGVLADQNLAGADSVTRNISSGIFEAVSGLGVNPRDAAAAAFSAVPVIEQGIFGRSNSFNAEFLLYAQQQVNELSRIADGQGPPERALGR